MSAYEAALYQFVVGATPGKIAKIRQLVDRQQEAERHWAKARAQVPTSELEKFDKTIYQDFVKLSHDTASSLQTLDVPLSGMDPRAQQKLLTILADLAHHTPKQAIH